MKTIKNNHYVHYVLEYGFRKVLTECGKKVNIGQVTRNLKEVTCKKCKRRYDI